MLTTLFTSIQNQSPIKIWNSNFANPQNAQENNTITYVTPQNDKVSISNEAKSFARLDEINQELNSIFGAPKKLSITQKIELNAIMKEMDKIYMKNSKNEIDGIYKKIDAIYKDGVITKNEAQNLATFEKQLSRLFIKNENINLTMNDELKLEDLNTKIDTLYENKEPTKNDLLRAQALFSEKETLFAFVLEQKGMAQTYTA